MSYINYMQGKLLLIIGLSINTLGALILLLPNLKPWKPLSDDYIINQKNDDSDDPKFIQVRDLLNLTTSISGFILLSIGFILQLIGTIIT